MSHSHNSRSRDILVRGASLLTLLLLIGGKPATVRAAVPASGTLTPSTTTQSWTGTVFGASADESSCVDGTTCDVYTLTLAPGDYTGMRITIGIDWLIPANDYDLYVHSGTVDGPIVTQSAGGGARHHGSGLDSDRSAGGAHRSDLRRARGGVFRRPAVDL